MDRTEPPVTTTVRMQRTLLVLVVLTLAFAFLGSRGLWDPDEGRYTNVAANMLSSGDWLVPHRTHDVGHWTKPPLTYWAVAASLGVFGMNTWAARVPIALAYLLSTWCVWRIARRLVPERARFAAIVYATMLLPAIASQLVTTDFLLTAWETLAMWAYVELRWGSARFGWRVLMWAAFALAFLTKGPPGLLPLLAIVFVERALTPRRRVFHPLGLFVFAALALWWFVVVVSRNPALLQYFLGMEVVDRFTTDEFRRNGQWYGWLVVYAPTLVLGALPWTPLWFGWLRKLPGHMRTWRSPEGRANDPADLLLAAWTFLPLVVFCLARSRLPLYVLPLFAPIALAVAVRSAEIGGPVPWRRLVAWVPLLIGLRLASAMVDSPQDARAWADAVRARVPGAIDQVVFVDQRTRYGLRLHLDADVEDTTLATVPRADGATINPHFDEDAADELIEDHDDAASVWICATEDWPKVQQYMAVRGYRAHAMGTPYRGSIVFHVRAR
jgi:4-amino-4-deoxy-L-arabinose transferase-like glycosyltransferase